MKLLLFDRDPELCESWRAAFAELVEAGAVLVCNAALESIPGAFDCLVTPANSFGLMDGGIDAAVIDLFGPALEDRVQGEIWRQYRGEQPVGTCLLVPTFDGRCAWLAHCPTMRAPMDVAWTNNAYAALLSALIAAETAGVEILACPGLCTHTGQMPPDVAASQMRFAYDCWRAPFAAPDWNAPRDREWRSHGRSRAEFLKHRFGPNL